MKEEKFEELEVNGKLDVIHRQITRLQEKIDFLTQKVNRMES